VSSLNLCDLDDNDLVIPTLVSALVDAFKLARNRFPESITVTADQANKFFFANNEVMSNFKGIPIIIASDADKKGTQISTINAIIKGMHTGRVHDIVDVYQKLESMKEEITRE
jgi:hypothetical protein